MRVDKGGLTILINNLPIRKTCCFIDGNTSDALIDASLVLKHMDSH